MNPDNPTFREDLENSAKQLIVMRKDLNMRKGKMIAQGAHASLSVILNLMDGEEEQRVLDLRYTRALRYWMDGLFTKVCVYVNSETELLAVHKAAKEKGLLASLIQDAGRTEFKEPTYTCCAVGPAFDHEFIGVTDHLHLL